MFSTIQEGVIAHKAKGSGGSFTDKIFIQQNETKTIGELLAENKYQRNNEHYVDALKDIPGVEVFNQ